MTGPNPPRGKALPLPSPERYRAALQRLRPRLSEGQLAMLEAHFRASSHTLSARQLAVAASYPTPHSANLQYGKLGRLLREELPYDGPGQQSYALASFTKPPSGEWQWHLHGPVVEALTGLQWFPATAPAPSTQGANEDQGQGFVEGAANRVLASVFERDPKARAACLGYHGTACSACDSKMSDVYGQVASGLIHVHHLVPLASVAQSHQVDPVADLRPVCPNCHSVIHLRDPPYKIEEVTEMIKVSRKSAG